MQGKLKWDIKTKQGGIEHLLVGLALEWGGRYKKADPEVFPPDRPKFLINYSKLY